MLLLRHNDTEDYHWFWPHHSIIFTYSIIPMNEMVTNHTLTNANQLTEMIQHQWPIPPTLVNPLLSDQHITCTRESCIDDNYYITITYHSNEGKRMIQTWRWTDQDWLRYMQTKWDSSISVNETRLHDDTPIQQWLWAPSSTTTSPTQDHHPQALLIIPT